LQTCAAQQIWSLFDHLVGAGEQRRRHVEGGRESDDKLELGRSSIPTLISPILDLNPLERARTELKLAPGFLVRSAPKPRRVVDRVGA